MNVVINALKIFMLIQLKVKKMNISVRICVKRNIFIMKKKKYVLKNVKLNISKFNIQINVLNLAMK